MERLFEFNLKLFTYYDLLAVNPRFAAGLMILVKPRPSDGVRPKNFLSTRSHHTRYLRSTPNSVSTLRGYVTVRTSRQTDRQTDISGHKAAAMTVVLQFRRRWS